MSKAVLEAKELVHTYKTGVTALKGVNLTVYENEIVGIVGQNGSGKTTLVRHFNGLLKPTKGTVYINGEDTTKQSVASMSRRVGYVFQNPNHQIFCTSVREELEVAAKNFGFSDEEKEASINRVVELMDLKDILDTHPLTLDYTAKKIITTASVMVFKPEILILDEPTGGLDEAGRRLLTKIMHLMHDEGHTVVIISHDMDYIAENVNRVVVMAEGEIIDDGTPSEVFSDREVLRKAWIEPPQITQLDISLSPEDGNLALSVKDFVKKYANR